MALTDKIKNYLGGHYLSPGMVFALDMFISLVASLFAVLLIRFVSDPFGPLNRFIGLWLLLSALASALAFWLTSTYKIIIRHSSYKSIGKIIAAVICKEAALAIAVLLGSIKYYSLTIEWLVLLMDALLSFVFLLLLRLIVVVIFDMARNTVGQEVRRIGVLIYGVGDNSVAMASRLELSDNYRVEGFLTSRTDCRDTVILSKPVFVYNEIEDVKQIKEKADFQCLIFTADDPEDRKANLIACCMDQGIHILSSQAIDNPDLTTFSHNLASEAAAGSEYIEDGMTTFERTVKRAIDCVLAFFLLILVSPLFLICWIAVKVEDGGPAIYKQERIGRFGRPFKILKFRSMKVDAESAGPALFAGDNDARLTKVGRFLRAHHLDELPQLWNVFMGDMAFVGPRPERKFYIDQISKVDPRYFYLYQIRPGVTSYATLRNGYTDSMEKMLTRLEYDLYYLKHRSWWFDIRILGMTFLSIVFGKKF